MSNQFIPNRRKTDKFKRTLVKLMDLSVAISLILIVVYCHTKVMNG